jgi:hypothetical protein
VSGSWCDVCEGQSSEWCSSECEKCGKDGVHTRKAGDFAGWCEECADNYDGPPDGEAWSGGFAENH